MKSFAAVDRIEGPYTICELEMCPAEISNVADFFTKETIMIGIPIADIYNAIGNFREGDILVVEHDCNKVTAIYSKDEEEKQRRIEIIRNLIG